MRAIIKMLCLLNLAMICSSCGGGGGGSSAAPNPPPVNQAPTANAGADQSADEGTTVDLSATGADGDGTIASYSWQQESGTTVTVTDADMANASFDVPMVAASEVLVFRVTVTDDDGATGTDTVSVSVNDTAPAALTVTVDAEIKQLNFSWTELAGATHYRLFENADGHSGFTQIGADIPAGTLSANVKISVHMFDFVNALYIVQGCDAASCTDSSEISVTDVMLSTIGYFKASNSGDYQFGSEIALSADGATMAVGANTESSNATGINGDQSDSSANASGAVYLFRYDGADWFQQAYIKASNSETGDQFGESLALSADGNTLVVGTGSEASSATGINGDQDDNSASGSGAVYVFRFDGTDWFQQAYVKASNSEADDNFGGSLALSANGNTLVVGAGSEASSATGINGDQDDNSSSSGAAYVFRFDGTDWFQQAFVKASNGEAGDGFGGSLASSSDGNTVVIGSGGESSNATGIDGNQSDNSAEASGAVYVFRYDGTDWFQQAYVKASNTDVADAFGGGRRRQLGLSGDGNTLAVGAYNEQSNATDVNGDHNDNSVDRAGAAYVFVYDGADWSQSAYIKSSKAVSAKRFGYRIALSADGTTLAVGVQSEHGCAAGVGGDENNNTCGNTGAVYVFSIEGTDWAQTAYVKASNPHGGDIFGDGYGGWAGIALNEDGTTLAVGADAEASNATGIGGNQNNNSVRSGAVYPRLVICKTTD